jgi:phage regulator Rha-like protein
LITIQLKGDCPSYAGYNISTKVVLRGQTLNNNNKLNAALSFMHLQYNAQQEKKIGFFYCTHIMMIVVSIFFTQCFAKKKKT